MKEINGEQCMTPKEAAQYLNLSPYTIYGWVKRNFIRFYKIGPKKIFIPKSELDRSIQLFIKEVNAG